MSAVTADQTSSFGLKRSGSINLLKGRSGSLRSKDGHKRTSSQQAPALRTPPQRTVHARLAEKPWASGHSGSEKSPIISYAVTITAGPDSADISRPKERRRMLNRLLHKRTASRPALPQISEAEDRNHLKADRTSYRGEPHSKRGHSRSTSALSFFHPDSTEPVVSEGDITPWPQAINTAYNKKSPLVGVVSPKNGSEIQKSSPLISRYNVLQAPTRPRAPSVDKESRGTAMPRSDALREELKPKLRIMADIGEDLVGPKNITHDLPDALKIASHPPRKSSLASTETSPPAPACSTEALVKSLEDRAEHRRKRSKDRTMLDVAVSASQPENGQHTPPTPPPKDDDSGYHVAIDDEPKPSKPAHLQNPKGLEIVMPGLPNQQSIVFRDVFALDQQKPASKPPAVSNALPSPRLALPLRSTLATRRHGVPSTIYVSRPSKRTDVRGVRGDISSPGIKAYNYKVSKRSSRNGSRLNSPAISKAVAAGTEDQMRLAIRRKPVRSSVAREPEIPEVALQPRRRPPPPPINTTGVRQESVVAVKEKVPEVPAKDPRRSLLVKRVSDPKRRSFTDPSIGSMSRSSSSKRKSVHRRRPTGFLITKPDGAANRKVAEQEVPMVPSILEQTLSATRAGIDEVSPATIATVMGTSSTSGTSGKSGMSHTPPQWQDVWDTPPLRRPAAVSREAKGRRQQQQSASASRDPQRRERSSGRRTAAGSSSNAGSSGEKRAEKKDRERTTFLTAARPRRPEMGHMPTADHYRTLVKRNPLAAPAVMSRSVTSPAAPVSAKGLALAMPPVPAATTPGAMNPLFAHPVPNSTAVVTVVIPAAATPAANTVVDERQSRKGSAASTMSATGSTGRDRKESVGATTDHRKGSATLTAEESIQRMMARQQEQAEVLRAKILGDSRRPSEA